MTREELNAVSFEDAKNDMVGYIRDIVIADGPHGLAPEQERAISIKMAYWTQLFFEKGKARVLDQMEFISKNMTQYPQLPIDSNGNLGDNPI